MQASPGLSQPRDLRLQATTRVTLARAATPVQVSVRVLVATPQEVSARVLVATLREVSAQVLVLTRAEVSARVPVQALPDLAAVAQPAPEEVIVPAATLEIAKVAVHRVEALNRSAVLLHRSVALNPRKKRSRKRKKPSNSKASSPQCSQERCSV